MATKLERVWLGDGPGGTKSIRLDWDNDRHHEVVIGPVCDADAVREALLQMAHLVGRDPHLRS